MTAGLDGLRELDSILSKEAAMGRARCSPPYSIDMDGSRALLQSGRRWHEVESRSTMPATLSALPSLLVSCSDGSWPLLGPSSLFTLAGCEEGSVVLDDDDEFYSL